MTIYGDPRVNTDETACQLIDEGCDVHGVGVGPLADTIAGNEIARIYPI